MASDTVPAAVPGPDDPPGATPAPPTSPPQPGGLSGLLAPVEPARAAFNLDPTTSTNTGEDTAINGASSATYHTDENTPQNSTKNGTGSRQERSIVRAWLLAGAERWKKGGDARLERLKMQKARHQANQVKETRTVAVNRSGGFLGSGSGSSGGGKPGGGKSLTSKTSGGGALKGPKNTGGGGRNGSGGRSGGSGGSAGGSGSGGGAGHGSSGGSNRNGSSGRGGTGGGTRGPKGSGGTSGPGTNGGGSKGSRGKDTGGSGKTLKRDQPKTSGGSGAKGGSSGSSGSPGGSGKTGPQGPAGRTGKDAPKDGTAKGNTTTPGPGGANGDGKKVDLKKKTPGKKQNTSDQKGQQPARDTTQPGKPDTKTTGTPKNPAPAGTAPNGKPLDTRESRETGYRDGTRAGRVVAHVQAYRDGARDGFRDIKEAAERQKQQLDQAHKDRKQQRAKDQTVTASSADYHPTPQTRPGGQPPEQANGPQPVKVNSIDATHLALGDGAARTHISRGEVRTLAGFQTRMAAKTDTMTRIADRTKALEAHAAAQAKKVTQLLEQAKGVKGGEKLISALTKLEEAAKVQEGKASEVRKRALRGHEACKVISSNVQTRYGEIYKAVIDSPETAPAEMSYYQDLGMTNA